MKAIKTHYVGCTDFRGSRIIATDGDNKAILTYDHGLDLDDNHKEAAKTLCRKLGWVPAKMQGGHTKKGMVWVWFDKYNELEIRKKGELG